jgi:hypothetical protein
MKVSYRRKHANALAETLRGSSEIEEVLQMSTFLPNPDLVSDHIILTCKRADGSQCCVSAQLDFRRSKLMLTID